MFSFIGRVTSWLVRHIDAIVAVAQVVARAIRTLREEGFWPEPAVEAA